VLTVPLYIAVLAVLLTTAGPSLGRAQDLTDQAKPETDTFFSGNVVEMAADHVTVSRAVLGKPPEKRTFKITPATKTEGKMKNKSRVTVRYAASDEGELAVSIIVRPDKAENGKKKD